MKSGIKGVENIYTQHKPLLQETLVSYIICYVSEHRASCSLHSLTTLSLHLYVLL